MGPKGSLGVAAGVTPVLMKCVAVCCSVLHSVALCCVYCIFFSMFEAAAVCCRHIDGSRQYQIFLGCCCRCHTCVLQCVAVCCSVLHCVVACCNVNDCQSRRHQRCRGCYCRCQGVVAGLAAGGRRGFMRVESLSVCPLFSIYMSFQ